MKNVLFYVACICISTNIFAQTLDFEFIKNCLILPEEELINQLNQKNFKLMVKGQKNLGDKLINKSNYYSNKALEDQSLEGGSEIAIFDNSKKSKKTIYITFTQNLAFNNFNDIEEQIKKKLKKEAAFYSEKYESTILKFSSEKNLFYLFKDEDTYSIIISNYPLEEVYFKN